MMSEVVLGNETPTNVGGKRGPVQLRLYICLGIVAGFILMGAVGPYLLPFNVSETSTVDRLLPPGSETSDGSIALFGTDAVGRDLLPQIFIGARISLLVGAGVLGISGVIGTIMGIVAGFVGGKLDALVMRLADIQLAFPGILLAILIASLLGPSVINVIVVLAVTKWVVFARVARAQTLAVKHREYVDAARVLGARQSFLVGRCILPACMAPLLVVATVELGLVIITEAALSFLGLGTPAGSPSWGLTIATGRDYLAGAWWISTIPGIALSLLVVAFGIVGDELRDRFDPHMQDR